MHEHDIREAVAVRTADEVLASGVTSDARRDHRQPRLHRRQARRAADGSRIAIELTGPRQRTLRVVVDGRGRVVEQFDDGAATSSIPLVGVLFTRLIDGRTAAALHPDAIGLRGFTAVGQAHRR
jgi:hypothetical protein